MAAAACRFFRARFLLVIYYPLAFVWRWCSGDAEAESIRLRGEAEAFAIEAKARAEAEQMAKKADAWKDYEEAAKVRTAWF